MNTKIIKVIPGDRFISNIDVLVQLRNEGLVTDDADFADRLQNCNDVDFWVFEQMLTNANFVCPAYSPELGWYYEGKLKKAA